MPPVSDRQAKLPGVLTEAEPTSLHSEYGPKALAASVRAEETAPRPQEEAL